MEQVSKRKSPLIPLYLLGFGIFCWSMNITLLSGFFVYGEDHGIRPIYLFAISYFIQSLLYLGVLELVRRYRPSGGKFLWSIIGFAILFRAIMLPGNLIQENDIYRYMWDGKVVAHGLNPYRFSPDEIKYKTSRPLDTDEKHHFEKIRQLYLERQYRESGNFNRIGWPEYKTIYPPVSQIVFAMGDAVYPDNILMMKFVLVLFDVATIFLLVRLLQYLNIPCSWIVAYAWCPLVLKEFSNSGHHDSIAVFFTTAAVLSWLMGRRKFAMLLLALATGAKVYPLVLVPLMLRNQLQEKGFSDTLKQLAVFVISIFLIYLPFISAGARLFHSLGVYSAEWSYNAGLWSLIRIAWQHMLGFFMADETCAGISALAAKITVGVLYSVILCWLCWPKFKNSRDLINRVLMSLGLLFVFSPVQDPWYFTWTIPFLAVLPYRSWTIYSALLGGYYILHFHYHPGMDKGLLLGLKMVQHAPFYLIFFMEKCWRCPNNSIKNES